MGNGLGNNKFGQNFSNNASAKTTIDSQQTPFNNISQASLK